MPLLPVASARSCRRPQPQEAGVVDWVLPRRCPYGLELPQALGRRFCPGHNLGAASPVVRATYFPQGIFLGLSHRRHTAHSLQVLMSGILWLQGPGVLGPLPCLPAPSPSRGPDFSLASSFSCTPPYPNQPVWGRAIHSDLSWRYSHRNPSLSFINML